MVELKYALSLTPFLYIFQHNIESYLNKVEVYPLHSYKYEIMNLIEFLKPMMVWLNLDKLYYIKNIYTKNKNIKYLYQDRFTDL